LNPAALDYALRWGYEAVAVVEANQPPPGSGITWISPRGLCLSNLGVTLHVKFEVQGDAAALQEVIAVSRAAVEATADDDPRLAMRMSYLGVALFRLYEWTGDTDALREAVHWDQEAVRIARDTAAAGGPPPRANGSRPTLVERLAWKATFKPGEIPLYLAILGTALQQWPVAARDREPLEKAIGYGMAAVADTRNGDPRRAEYLSRVAGAWRIGDAVQPPRQRRDPPSADREGDVLVMGGAGQRAGEVPGVGAHGYPPRTMQAGMDAWMAWAA
jgi:hypothetical protein